MITNNDACILTFVVLYNFAVEMEILSQLLSELNLNGEGYEEVSSQRRLMFDEMDMERDDTSSLGCATLSDYNDESLEGQLQETEGEGWRRRRGDLRERTMMHLVIKEGE